MRFYCLGGDIVFHGELGHNYLAIKNFIQAGQIPLLGPPTSHPWLSFGPLFYWIFAPVLVLAKYNPVSGAYFMAFASTLLIILNYFFIEKLFDKKAAIISSFLIAISPAFVFLSRESRFFSLVPLVFYPFLYFFVKSLEGKRYLFWAGFFFGVILNFHLSPIILVPAAVILLWLKKKSIKRIEMAKGLLGFTIPNIPFLIFNLQDKFEMLLKLLLWIPYRVAGLIGLYPKNTATSAVVSGSMGSLYEFLRLIFTTEKNIFVFLALLALLIFVLVKTIKSFQKNERDSAWPAIVLFFSLGCLGIFIHGNPPSHYYLPLYPTPIIFLSVFLAGLITKKSTRWIACVLLFAMAFLNLKFYFSSKRVYSPLVPYKLQLKIARSIVSDANGQKYSLRRVGYADKFEGNYAQNYQYLLWWMGNEPVSNSKTVYTIYEETDKLPEYTDGKIFWLENIAVYRIQSK